MSSSTLDLPVDRPAITGKGHGTAALGPSDSSDTGADLQGAGDDGGAPGGVITPTGRAIGDNDIDSDTDSHGTGEVMSAGRDLEVKEAADIGVDRVISADEAGLGTGLDQAEEARLGITDEEIDAEIRAGRADQLAARDVDGETDRDGSLDSEDSRQSSDSADTDRQSSDGADTDRQSSDSADTDSESSDSEDGDGEDSDGEDSDQDMDVRGDAR